MTNINPGKEYPDGHYGGFPTTYTTGTNYSLASGGFHESSSAINGLSDESSRIGGEAAQFEENFTLGAGNDVFDWNIVWLVVIVILLVVLMSYFGMEYFSSYTPGLLTNRNQQFYHELGKYFHPPCHMPVMC